MTSTASVRYTLTPRFENKQTGQPLSAYAVDVTILFQKNGAAFLVDHNFVGGEPGDDAFPHNNLVELKETLNGELDRLYEVRFGKQ